MSENKQHTPIFNPIQEPSGWDSCASKYHHTALPAIRPHIDAAIKDYVRYLPSTDPIVVTDIACGSGIVTQELLRSPEKITKVYSSDFSPVMVQTMEKILNDPTLPFAPHSHKVVTAVHDAKHLKSVPDHVVDVAICSFAIMIIPEPNDVMKEISRILKKDGLFVTLTWAEPIYSQLHSVMGNMFQSMSNDTHCPSEGSHFMELLPLNTLESVTTFFETCGFEVLQCRRNTAPLECVYHSAIEFVQACDGSCPLLISVDPKLIDKMESYIGQTMGKNSTFGFHSCCIICIGKNKHQ